MQEATWGKALLVILLLIGLNMVVRYVRAVRRQANAYRDQQRSSGKPVITRPKDEQLGEYVDYEELK
jgi:hypothetical protein